MNKLRSSLLAALALLGASAVAQTPSSQPAPAIKAAANPAPRVNSTGGVTPHETTTGYAGGNRRTGTAITITYGRPYTIKPGTTVVRKIWGGQVPWNKADRLGADEATLLITPLPLVVGEQTVPAGAYTLYIVPSETGVSKLAFSTNIAKWGVPVDETHDLGRFDLKKETLEKPVDQLTIAVVDDAGTPNGGLLKISWETTQFSLPFTVKK